MTKKLILTAPDFVTFFKINCNYLIIRCYYFFVWVTC